MFVVFPICHKDVDIAEKLLKWAKHIEGKVEYPALIVHDDLCDPIKVVSIANDYFSAVKVISYAHWKGREQKWPAPQNFQFQQTASYISANKPFGKDSWFWWEPDATPLKPGWLKILDDRYKEGGKPFMGHVVTGDPYGNGQSLSWMTGVGVYPFNMSGKSLRAMTTVEHPWDVVGARDIMPQCQPANDLIQHVWERNGAPYHFIDRADAQAILQKDAVIFHRCKDGSLMDALNEAPHYKDIVADIKVATSELIAKAKTYFTTPKTTAIVQLGRYGDIINALPAIRAFGQKRGQKQNVVVATEFADVLEGVSYVEPVLFNGGFEKLPDAIGFASQKYNEIIVSQVWGQGVDVRKECQHYNLDNWERLGMVDRWSEPMPPIFDQRNYVREREQINKIVPWTDEPLVAVSLSGGATSKLPEGANIKAIIKATFGNTIRLVDLDAFRFTKIFDAIGVLELADAIVTTDTVWLHLAAETNVPVAAFLSQISDWHKTKPRCKCTLELHDASDDSVNRLMNWLKVRVNSAEQRGFAQCCETHKPLPSRVRKAQRSWKILESRDKWKIAMLGKYNRDSRILGETRDLPFLRDVLQYGLESCGHDDYLVFTNDDTILIQGIQNEIKRVLSRGVALTANRIDIERWSGVPPTTVQTNHQGRDLLAFKSSWLRKHLNEFPDYALGLCDWDIGIAAHIRYLAGKKWNHDISWQIEDDCELRPGWVLHERHEPTYPNARTVLTPGLLYNRRLLRNWIETHDPAMKRGFWWWDSQQ